MNLKAFAETLASSSSRNDPYADIFNSFLRDCLYQVKPDWVDLERRLNHLLFADLKIFYKQASTPRLGLFCYFDTLEYGAILERYGVIPKKTFFIALINFFGYGLFVRDGYGYENFGEIFPKIVLRKITFYMTLVLASLAVYLLTRLEFIFAIYLAVSVFTAMYGVSVLYWFRKKTTLNNFDLELLLIDGVHPDVVSTLGRLSRMGKFVYHWDIQPLLSYVDNKILALQDDIEILINADARLREPTKGFHVTRLADRADAKKQELKTCIATKAALFRILMN